MRSPSIADTAVRRAPTCAATAGYFARERLLRGGLRRAGARLAGVRFDGATDRFAGAFAILMTPIRGV